MNLNHLKTGLNEIIFFSVNKAHTFDFQNNLAEFWDNKRSMNKKKFHYSRINKVKDLNKVDLAPVSTWRWGTLDRWGNTPRWGTKKNNLLVHEIFQPHQFGVPFFRIV